MINLNSIEYLTPTKQFRELSVMLALHHDHDLRQQEIAQQVNMSGAMVNSYIKQLKECGWIVVENKNRRDLTYRLSSDGQKHLMRHLMACSAEIVELYKKAKVELVDQLKEYFGGDQAVRVMLYGGSETARLVISVLGYFPSVEIVGVVDKDKEKWGKSIDSYTIGQPETARETAFDFFVISSFAKQDEISEAIRALGIHGIRIVKLSSL